MGGRHCGGAGLALKAVKVVRRLSALAELALRQNSLDHSPISGMKGIESPHMIQATMGSHDSRTTCNEPFNRVLGVLFVHNYIKRGSCSFQATSLYAASKDSSRCWSCSSARTCDGFLLDFPISEFFILKKCDRTNAIRSCLNREKFQWSAATFGKVLRKYWIGMQQHPRFVMNWTPRLQIYLGSPRKLYWFLFQILSNSVQYHRLN
jgi:hypothetical protein